MQSPDLPEMDFGDISRENSQNHSQTLEHHKSNLRNRLESEEMLQEDPKILSNKIIMDGRNNKKIVIRKKLVHNKNCDLSEPLLDSISENKEKEEKPKKHKIKFSTNQVHLVQSFKKYNKKKKCCFFYQYD